MTLLAPVALMACGTAEQTEVAAEGGDPVQLDLLSLHVVSQTVEDRAGQPVNRVEVQAGADPQAEADAFVLTLPVSLQAYVTSQNELDVDVRVYEGKHLTHHLTFYPSLGDPHAQSGLNRPLVALVVAGLGDDVQAGTTVLQARLPLSVAVAPFAPFSLLHARDAALFHKELLVDLGTDDPLAVAIAALPRSSGVLLREPGDLPADALDEVYLLDASGGDGVRRHPGVPLLTVTEVIDGDVADHRVRIENLADRNGAVLLLVDMDDRLAVTSTVTWLHGNQDRLRPVFVSEILDLERRLAGTRPD